jgi:starvation-inducible DNA-binding protein
VWADIESESGQDADGSRNDVQAGDGPVRCLKSPSSAFIKSKERYMAKTEKSSTVRRDTNAAMQELTKENRADSPVVQSLRLQTANAFLLYVNYKHYHWQTFGPHFRDMHKLFDKFAEEVLDTIDELAERVRMIGQDPPSHPLEMTDLATVEPAAPASTMAEMVEEANRNTLIVIKELRQAVRGADDHDDPGTADLFARIVQVHEKHEWWLRDILRKGDGFHLSGETH